ncbi:MAG: helix-turn-helix domain-containing protein [Gammaproteobacteria bacterium]|nr:helix-turn-helix domain-containing protein [Gammaproteobacteria bacterium]
MSTRTTCRTVVFRLHPRSRREHDLLTQAAGACQNVWNWALAENERQYREALQAEAHKADNGQALSVDMNDGQVAVSTGDILRMLNTSRLEVRKNHHPRYSGRVVKGVAWVQETRNLGLQLTDLMHQPVPVQLTRAERDDPVAFMGRGLDGLCN